MVYSAAGTQIFVPVPAVVPVRAIGVLAAMRAEAVIKTKNMSETVFYKVYVPPNAITHIGE